MHIPGTTVKIAQSLIEATIVSRNNDGTVNLHIPGYPPDTIWVAEVIPTYCIITTKVIPISPAPSLWREHTDLIGGPHESSTAITEPTTEDRPTHNHQPNHTEP